MAENSKVKPETHRAKLTPLADGFHSTRQRYSKHQRQAFKILARQLEPR